MHVVFEEDGSLKAASVLSATEASCQVEAPSGKRSKIKASHVVLRFERPSPAQLLEQAQAQAAQIDLDFLWECAPQEEFGFADLAREYFGHAPDAVEAAAILLRLHSAPVYFHRRGRGRFRPAPPEILRAALLAVERRRRQDELRDAYAGQLARGELPEAIGALGAALVIDPDRNGVEFKALEQAARSLQTTPLRLLIARGAIASPYRWHVDSFLARAFPRGTGFPAELPAPPAPIDSLPLAEAEAFAIDDSTTTEIDDAFSVRAVGNRLKVGIHIAAPALAIVRGDELDAVARARMSTVYAPGLKFTMLPPAWVERFSLAEGRELPVLSLYLDVDPGTWSVLSWSSALERVRIAANLRHDRLDDRVTEESLASGRLDVPFGEQLHKLWRLACALLAAREAARGRPEPKGRVDYTFVLDGEGESARVSLRPRPRGAPLDLIVAELMIFANSRWGAWLEETGRVGIYRSQSLGRVRMSTAPAPHDGIGVRHYAWSTSPLRRYVDLVNQRQLLSALRGEAPAYARGDAELFAIVSAFDAAYGSFADFQAAMERYWCLRWLQQEARDRIGATILKGDVVRLDGLPLVVRLPGLPALPRGQRVELDILGQDLLDLSLDARLRQVLEAAEPVAVEDLDEDLGVLGDPGAAVDPPEPVEPGVAGQPIRESASDGAASGAGAG
ncbi:MAG TPA: ribonuclease catalytic domain-containing protein [Burkholderiaceae bacterium]